MKIKVVENDFLNADIDSLLADEPEENTKDINAIFDAYDRELMAFKPRERRQWPAPIRKEVCTR